MHLSESVRNKARAGSKGAEHDRQSPTEWRRDPWRKANFSQTFLDEFFKDMKKDIKTYQNHPKEMAQSGKGCTKNVPWQRI